MSRPSEFVGRHGELVTVGDTVSIFSNGADMVGLRTRESWVLVDVSEGGSAVLEHPTGLVASEPILEDFYKVEFDGEFL